MSTTIDQLQIEFVSNSNQATTGIDNLSSSLDRLKRAGKLTTVTNNLNKLNQSIIGLKANLSGLQGLDKITQMLNSLGGVSTKGLNSTLNSLKKLPKILDSLDTKTMTRFKEVINDITQALVPLNKQLDKASKGFGALPGSVNRVNKAMSKTDDGIKSSGNSMSGFLNSTNLSIGAILVVAHQMFDVMGGWLNQINEYIENVNLFTVSMGGFYEQAREYAELVQDKLGIDSSEWMRNQGIFMSMATGFGLANEQAYKLSKGLTEISYDLSSFFNLPIEEAFLKVRSGLAGELEPLRSLGFALSEASLQELAYQKGVTKSIQVMTEAEKAQLRYVAIVEQASRMGAVGDLAKTLESPSNAIRILKQQVTQLARSLGSVLLPIIQQVIPYVQAFVKVLTNLIKSFAILVGFEMPEWDNDSWDKADTSVGGIESGLGGAVKKAKELKNATLGFDELNIISPPTDSGSGAGAGGVGGDLGLDLDSVWDEAMIQGIDSQVDELAKKMENFGSVLKEMFIDPLKVIDLNPLKESLNNLWEALKPFAGTVGAGLYWFYLNVLVPLAQWTIEDVLPAFLNGLADALNWLTPKLQEFGNWFINNLDSIKDFAMILASLWLGFKGAEVIAKFLPDAKTLAELFGKFGGLGTAVSSAFGFIKSALVGLLVPVQAAIVIFNASGGGLGGVLAVLQATLSSVGSAFVGLLGSIAPVVAIAVALGAAIYVVWQNWDLVVKFFKDFIDNIDLKGKFEGIMQSLQPLVEKFAGLKDLLTVIGTVIGGVVYVALGTLAGAFTSIVSAIEPLIQAIGGVIDILSGLGTFIVGVFTIDLEKIGDGIVKMGQGIVDVFSGLWGAVSGFVIGFFQGIDSWFGNIFSTAIKWISDMVSGIVDFFISLPANTAQALIDFATSIGDFFSNLWDEHISPWFSLEKWKELGKNAIDGLFKGLGDMWNGIKQWGSDMLNGVKDALGIHSPSVEMENIGVYMNPGLFNGIMSNVDLVLEATQFIMDSIKELWTKEFKLNKKQSGYFYDMGTTMMTSLIKGFHDMMSALTEQLNQMLESVRSTMNAAASSAASAAASIRASVASALRALEELDSAESSAGGKSSGIGSKKSRTITESIQVFAKGGFIEDGLFTMNHGEIAGKFSNGQSVVANNDQIIEGIASGVYEAVSRAMSESSGDKPISLNVYLDSKQIRSSIKKADNEKGRSIFGDQLGYNY